MTIILKKMNDILKIRIEEAAINGSKNYDPNISMYSQGKQVGYIRGFNEGAEYALSHQFISVEDALPEYNKAVLIIDKTGIEGNGVYFNHRSNNPIVNTYENGFCDIGLSEVMYWCEVPKFETKNAIKRIR